MLNHRNIFYLVYKMKKQLSIMLSSNIEEMNEYWRNTNGLRNIMMLFVINKALEHIKQGYKCQAVAVYFATAFVI